MKTGIVFVMFMLGVIVRGMAQEKDTTYSITCMLPVMPSPEYPGGWKECIKFIKEHVKYPFGTTCVQGAVFVSFTVCEDGSLADFAIVRGLCRECDENALEVLRKMPRWNPAKAADKKPVESRMTLPVRFNGL